MPNCKLPKLSHFALPFNLLSMLRAMLEIYSVALWLYFSELNHVLIEVNAISDF